MADKAKSIKPKLRGYLHQEAFYIALGASALLIAKSSNSKMVWASVVYSLGLLAMFGISALYHRPHWQPQWRGVMKRLDHSAIFVFIAGTMTPICLLALPDKEGFQLLLVGWCVGIAGVLQAMFWVNAPKPIKACFYVFMGWLSVPYVSELTASLGPVNTWMIVLGGIFYTAGAVFYATRWPKLVPHIFGYHEFFHAFTLIAATLHFIVIYQLIK
jgi:hemolysin III